jgi:branched-chain amino acid aminotransferase
MINIDVIKSTNLKQKPSEENLGFGTKFTDHMFVVDYEEGKGWHNPRVEPYQPIEMDPAAMVLHYGQTVFEGLKAYNSSNKETLLFRPMDNFKRLNLSCQRVSMPTVDPELAMAGLTKLLELEKEWIPSNEGNSLYIRPFVFATDPFLGVRASLRYKFIIILSPVGAYYPEGVNPVKIYVEENYVRAIRGGLGTAKTAANYVASIKAQMEAKEKGFSQVLWLDGVERKYVEEVGTMNVFFKINGEIITPALDEGTILAGITRDSTIALLKNWGYNVVERKISIDEVIDAKNNGTLEEAFGTGTAAVISPVGELFYQNQANVINNGKIGEVSQRIYDTLTGIQLGKLEDTFNWTVKL